MFSQPKKHAAPLIHRIRETDIANRGIFSDESWTFIVCTLTRTTFVVQQKPRLENLNQSVGSDTLSGISIQPNAHPAWANNQAPLSASCSACLICGGVENGLNPTNCLRIRPSREM